LAAGRAHPQSQLILAIAIYRKRARQTVA